MSIFSKIKDLFGFTKEGRTFRDEKQNLGIEQNQEISEGDKNTKSEAAQSSARNNLTKFDAEYYNPPQRCFYCDTEILQGKLRFVRNGGVNEPFHKRCFKKMQRGVLPEKR